MMARKMDWTQPQVWQETAQLLERGRFDVMFFADNIAANDHYAHSPDAAIKYSLQFPAHDPVPLISFLAATTTKIGLAATSSVTYTQPYYTARLFATLAHLTAGRVAWNVVSSSFEAEAANFGLDEVPAHKTRYDRSDEFVDVCKALWSSWEPGAVVVDREHRIWADPSKIHAIDHVGEHYSSKGPLNVMPAPNGPPVLFGAGQSDRGLDSCARHAEVIFGIQFDGAGMRRQRDIFREKVAAEGRDPDSAPVLWGVFPIVGETEAAAREMEAAILENVPAEGGLAFLSNHLGIDASTFDLDAPLSSFETESESGSIGMIRALMKTYGEAATVRELAKIYGCGLSPHVVGTAEQVADQLEALYDEAGGDGFLLMSSGIPGALSNFVEQVVPILQERGRFRKEYAGNTLREHLSER